MGLGKGLIAVGFCCGALAVGAGAAVSAPGYHGSIHIDFRYTSGGGGLRPSGPADIEQTAHLVVTVANGRIRRLNGVVGFDYKWINTGCPNFTVETIGGGTVKTKLAGDGYAFMDSWNWSPPRHGHYVTPEPTVPPAAVTSMSTSPDNDCNTLHQTDRATFEIGYVPMLSGTIHTPRRVVGSLNRTYQGYNACHAFSPLPPPPPIGVSCTWRMRWTLVR